ncbi:alpha/beta-hydrolase [Xylariomycetidae sp. FL0641]|nr:alpha/beta-hydrolase [Xylariomycetidae sp. FL0641]
MALDALTLNDPRVEHKFANVGNYTYHYMLAKPEGKPVATIFLCHGWPDLGMGWRNQVPYLLSLGLQVAVPDMLGFGQTSAPEAAEEYTFKKMTSHMAQVIKEVTNEPIILGGHDWGGAFVWRMAMYYPELIRAVFSICVPFWPLTTEKVSLEAVVEKMPNFKYQLQLASGEAERKVGQSPERLAQFITGMFGGRTPDGELLFTTEKGIIEENLGRIQPTPLVSKEMIDFYAHEYARHGLHGPCNWYRTRLPNADDEVPLSQSPEYKDFQFPMPAMLIMADKDAALPPQLAEGQERFFKAGLKRGLLQDCSHWAMLQKPVEVNQYIGDFVKGVLGGDTKSAL